MVRETGPTRGPPPLGPPGEDRPPFDMGPPGWGPPPGWPPLDEWGPPPPGGWGPMPPHGWGPPPPEGWGPRGPPPPDWDLRRPMPPGWPHPDDWLPPPDWRRLHPDDWRRLHPDDWRRLYPEEWRHVRDVDWRTPRDEWRLPPEGWGPPHCWGPEGPPPPETWGPDGPPPPIPPIPPIPPPDPAAFGPMPVPPIPPPECVTPVPPPVPPFGFPAFPPPGWTEPPPVEEAMPNPPPDQPEWIKALISAPTSDSMGADPKTKTSSEDHLAIKPPEAAPAPVPPKPKKPKAAKPAKSLALLGKRTFEKPPPGRSTGIISFIGPTFGHVEREDLEKFTFSFDAFFGNPKAMTPGVRVHFTACKEKKNQIATDVKVAPGGTENVDPEIYEAVVSQPIVEPQPGERQYPGQVYVTIGPLRTNLSFERRDSTVTLLKEDQVLINLLSDLVTEKRRATNIRPKIPATFSHTKETRETGVIISLEGDVGIIKSDDHGEIPFEIRENFSDVEFTTEDINEEVEFTIITLRNGKRAIRIRRVKEPLLLTLCSAATEASKEDDEDEDDEDEEDSEDEANMPLFLKPKSRPEQGPNMKLDTELYEGIVSQPIIEPTTSMPGYPGQIHANIGPLKTNVTFDHRDCGVTLLKNDHVLINLLIDITNKKRRAANIKPKIPFTFSYTKEKRELGIITFLGPEEGIVNSDDHGELPFDICENFSDTEFNSQDIHKEVEFTVARVQMKKRAIRLMRTRKVNDKILEEQKKRCEEEKKKKENEGEDEKRQEEDERRKKEEEEEEQEEEQYKVAKRKKKEEVAAALAAAQHKWTPFGFKLRDPDSQDEISKDRFEGTVLKAIGKHSQNEMKKELPDKTEESGGGGALNGQTVLQQQVKIKEEKEDESKPVAGEEQTEVKIKKEEEEEVVMKAQPTSDLGRLVMTIDGQQKQLPFGPGDLLTTATMLDGDKVRFNVATNQVTKVERATYVEILPDSFEESTEQRRHGIVIEFSSDSGLIKCSQNPQLYFHMSEVIERKKLELNEKVEFSVVPHETAEGGNQAIRIKRYTESVFLPTRKLGGVGANKGKMTIKLTKPDVTEKEKPDTDKLKAVVKNLRAQDSRSRREYSATRRRYSSKSRSRSRSRGKSRSSSRSPPRDQFGRVTKRKRSPSVDRDRKSSRARRSHSREKRSRRTRSRSSSQSRTRSRSRSRERSKERSGKRRSKSSREQEESHRRRKEFSPPPSRRPGLMDDELARKKRELEELNEMIAYKKSLVDPRGMDPGQRTCIDYDHGRIAIPLTEYQPVRSILKKRPEGPEYHHRPPQPYDDPYYDRPYQDHRYSDPYAKRYGDPYTSHPYPDRPYSERPFGDRPYESHGYSEVPYGAPPATSHRYTDRYDVYDEPFDDRYSDPVYADRRYTSPYPPSKRSQSPEPCRSSPTSQSTPVPGSSTQNLSACPSAGPPFRPPSPAESPPRSPPPKHKKISPPVEKPPLDRFLDMLNKKKSDTGKVSEPIVHDDLLPHERALQDGRGFSRIVGLTQEQPSTNLPLEMEPKPQSPKSSSAERITKELNNTEEPYDKIQSLLRTIGLKLSTGDMSKLSNRTQGEIYSPKSSSAKRDIPREEQRTTRTGSVELDHIHSPSPTRSSSLEPRHKVVNEYEGFLDQQELEALQKAQQLQSLTRTMGLTSTTAPVPKHPPGSPPAQYQHLPSSMTWSLDTTPSSQSSSSLTQTPTTAAEPAQKLSRPPPGPPPGPPPRRPSLQTPPGPPPGPPPRRPPGQPPFIPTSSHVLPFIGQSSAAPPTTSSVSSQPPTTAATAPPSTPAMSPSSSNEDAAISTTVARCLKVIETVKSLAVQPPTKPVKSVQFSLPSTSTPQASTEMEDETKTLQTEKTDLFNQRTTERGEHEYQRKKQEKNKDGTEISPGKPIGSEQKNIWICGHSLVYWAESRSKSAEVGVHLGLDPRRMALWWKGVQGMTWPQLLPQLHQLKVTWPNPDVLIMHLGGNDLSTDSPTELLASVRRDLTSMRTIFPRCVLVWSYILPRRVWRHSPDSYEVDLVRTTVNRRIHSIVSELGGASLTHDNIRCGTNTGLYRADGIHLSPKGIDMFNLNVRDFLEKWEVEVNKTE